MGTGKTARNSALIIKTCQVQNLVMGVPTLEEISKCIFDCGRITGKSGRRRGNVKNVTQAAFRWITWAGLLTVVVSSATSRNVLVEG